MIINQLINFIADHPAIFIFYGIIIFLLIFFRKRIDRQAKIIFLLRTRWGLKWMDKYSNKLKEWIILLGYISMGVGFVGLVVISYVLIKNLYQLITVPMTTSGVSLVLPGMNIPGVGVLPFWYWIIAIFIIAVVHEFAHGIVARAHNLEVKNTGLVLFGPIIGAFVEPNENKLRKLVDIKQYSVLAAGSFSNILLAVLAVIMLNFVFMPLQQGMVEPTGFTFDTYYEKNYPVEKAGVVPGTLITGIDGINITNFQQFSEELTCKKVGEKLTLNTVEKNYFLTLMDSPDYQGKGFLGISAIRNEFEIKDKYDQGAWKIAYFGLDWFNGLLRWLFLLSLGIGLFNLLPLPIVDGGRMAQVFLQKLKGQEKGNKIYNKVSLFFLMILLLNLFFPLFVKLF